jgi:hypothetical protein
LPISLAPQRGERVGVRGNAFNVSLFQDRQERRERPGLPFSLAPHRGERVGVRGN